MANDREKDKKKKTKKEASKLKLPKKKNVEKQIKKISKKYSTESYLYELMEECSELIQAANKYRRAVTKKDDMKKTTLSKKKAKIKLIEEIADVERLIFIIKYKLKISDKEIDNEIKGKTIRNSLRQKEGK
jgi:NTP pyrophosphatase (non-canonical NTP hydrolase)